MKVLVLGAGGMIGQKLLQALARQQPDADVIAHDIVFPPQPAPASETIIGSLTEPGAPKPLAAKRPDVI